MKTIEIDEQVFAELSRRAIGFHVTPNDVLRGILNLTAPGDSRPVPVPEPPIATTLLEFVRSERFQRQHQAVDRFLAILAWLHAAQRKQFADAALGFHRGKRFYFGKSQKDIEQSGQGITAKPIPQSPFWVLTTLDNKSKRIVLEELLHALGYSRSDVDLVLSELPDSNIRRRHGTFRPLES